MKKVVLIFLLLFWKTLPTMFPKHLQNENTLTTFIDFTRHSLYTNTWWLTQPTVQILVMIYIGLFFISRFWLKSLLYKACHNSGTGEKISMKCGSQTQLDKLKMKMSKNSNNNLAKAYCGVILILALFTRYGALCKPDFVIIRFNSLNSILRQLLFFD